MIYRAVVADSRDPADKGRLRVMIPSLSGSAISDWIWPVVSSGRVVVPDAGDQIWVAFENGDRDVPVWLGTTKPSSTQDPVLEAAVSDISALQTAVADIQSAVADVQVDAASHVSTDGSVTQIVTLTQSEYDALSPDPTTLYVIVG